MQSSYAETQSNHRGETVELPKKIVDELKNLITETNKKSEIRELQLNETVEQLNNDIRIMIDKNEGFSDEIRNLNMQMRNNKEQYESLESKFHSLINGDEELKKKYEDLQVLSLKKEKENGDLKGQLYNTWDYTIHNYLKFFC